MCGICGVVGLSNTDKVDASIITGMCESIAHRGPDGDGVYCVENAGLGHRRLSIIDIDGGQQPLCNEDGKIWIVFNGEIYNHKELRVFLEKKGHTIKSSSDTEILVHLYEEYGVDAIQHLDGIFAYAIWDSQKKQITLARDRTGIKPLYYTIVNGQLIFGSELKALFAHPSVKRDIDISSLYEYLSFEYVPTPSTIIKNVKRLAPGHYLLADKNNITVRQYWDFNLSRSETLPPIHWRDYVDKLETLFSETIKAELTSDVPVGVFLSGGLDSSAVTAFMARHYGGVVNSFSVGFEDKSFDESAYAKIVADRFGTKHHSLILSSKEAAGIVHNMMEYLDEPFGDSSFIPTFLVSKLASQHVKVVLGGDGGDEMFAGYPTFIAHRLVNHYASYVPWFMRARMIPYIIRQLPTSFNNISLDFKLKRFLAGRNVPCEIRHHRWLGSFYEEGKQQLLQDWVKPVVGETYQKVALATKTGDASQELNKMLYLDMKFYLEGDILYKVDRASMANSLEVRVPFLNRRILDFCSALPVNMKLRRYTGKYLLKKTMLRELPAEIVNRPKKGFNIPVAKWINGELSELVGDMLSNEALKKHNLFNEKYVHNLLSEHKNHKKDHRKLLWTLMSFQLWHDKYIA